MVDQTIPNNLEAEQAILGAIMMDSGILVDLSLEPEHFYKGTHQRIYSAMLDLHDLGEPIDLVMMSERLQDKGLTGALTRIVTESFTAANYEMHSRILRDLSAKRQILQTCMSVQSKVHGGVELEELVSAMSVDIDTGKQESVSPVARVAKEAMGMIDHRVNNKHDLSGVRTGFLGLDLLMDGAQNGDLIIIGGRPSMGKTAFAGQIAMNAEVPVHFVSVEMKNVQLVYRMLSVLSDVTGHKIRKGMVSDDDMIELQIAADVLAKKKITMDDVSFKLYDIRRSILQAHRQGARLVIVDYLQLISNKASSREREIGEICTMLKNTAKQLNIPVIALAQLNRSVEQRENKRPTLIDLRDSGQIEQDADIVIFLHREGYYAKQKSPNAEDVTAQIIVAKGRNIGTDTIQVGWDGPRTKFMEG